MKIRILFRIALLASLGFLLELLKIDNNQTWDDIVGVSIGISVAVMLIMLGIKMYESSEKD